MWFSYYFIENTYAKINMNYESQIFHMLCMEEIYRFDTVMDYNFNDGLPFHVFNFKLQNEIELSFSVVHIINYQEVEIIEIPEFKLKMKPDSIQTFKERNNYYSLEVNIMYINLIKLSVYWI